MMTRTHKRNALLTSAAAVGLAISLPVQAQSDWNQTGGGTFSWTDGGNWVGGVPNAVDAIANLNATLTADQTINLDAAITLGTLALDGGTVGNYTIANGAGGSLTFERSEGNAVLTVISAAAGGPAISADLTLNSRLDITNSSEQVLTLSGSVGGPDMLSLPAPDSGTVNLTGNLTTGSFLVHGSGSRLVISGPTTFSGVAQLGGGTVAGAGAILELHHPQALGSTSVINGISNNGVLRLHSDTGGVFGPDSNTPLDFRVPLHTSVLNVGALDPSNPDNLGKTFTLGTYEFGSNFAITTPGAPTGTGSADARVELSGIVGTLDNFKAGFEVPNLNFAFAIPTSVDHWTHAPEDADGNPASGVSRMHGIGVATDARLEVGGFHETPGNPMSFRKIPVNTLGVNTNGAGTLAILGPSTISGSVGHTAGTIEIHHHQAFGTAMLGNPAGFGAPQFGAGANPVLLIAAPLAEPIANTFGNLNNFNIAGAHPVEFSGVAELVQDNRTLTVSNTAGVTFSGPVVSTVPLHWTKTGAGTMTLSGNNTLGVLFEGSSQFGAITVAGGTVVAAHENALGRGALQINSGAVLQIQPGLSGVMLRPGHQMQVIDEIPQPVVTRPSLNILGTGVLDVTDSKAVIVDGDLDQITDWLASGRNGGTWDGPGINSSTAAAEPGRAVGLQQNGGDATVAFTWAGDASMDGQVTIADLGILAANWQQSERFWFHGDFNYDRTVTIADLGILAANWQKGVAAGAAGMSFEEAMAMFDVFQGVVVPEPASLGVLALGGIGLMGRRRRQ